jgi:uncharacterized membrane protein
MLFALPKKRVGAFFEKSVLFYRWGLKNIIMVDIIPKLPWGEQVHTVNVLRLFVLMKSMKYSSIQGLIPILRSF